MTNTGLRNSPGGSGQAVWGWKVAAYLFLAGVGAGAYAAGAVADFLGTGWETASRTGITLGPLLVLVSTVFLIADLGVPGGFLRAGARPRSSWISRGVLILTPFVIIGLINIFLLFWPWHLLQGAHTARLALEGVGIALALLTMVYTGLLLGAVRPILFWNNAMLPVLFLLSALSTGLMVIMLALSVSPAASGFSLHAQLYGLARADALILGFEAVVVFFYLQGCYASPASRPSAELLLTGSLAPIFWAGLVASGIAFPLVYELVALSPASKEVETALAMAASIFGLAGGLLLRYLIVAGGMRIPLKAAGMLLNTSGKARF